MALNKLVKAMLCVALAGLSVLTYFKGFYDGKNNRKNFFVEQKEQVVSGLDNAVNTAHEAIKGSVGETKQYLFEYHTDSGIYRIPKELGEEIVDDNVTASDVFSMDKNSDKIVSEKEWEYWKANPPEKRIIRQKLDKRVSDYNPSNHIFIDIDNIITRSEDLAELGLYSGGEFYNYLFRSSESYITGKGKVKFSATEIGQTAISSIMTVLNQHSPRVEPFPTRVKIELDKMGAFTEEKTSGIMFGTTEITLEKIRKYQQKYFDQKKFYGR